jgi:TolB-like protein
MRRFLLSLTALAALASAALAGALDRPRVAVVPILNLSGEKWEELKAKQSAKATEFLTEQFTRRGFDLVPPQDVKGAIAELKLDFTDEEQQKRATLFDLGKKLNADYILLGVITHTEQKEFQRVLYKDIEGRTDAKIWFLDVRGEKPILSAKTFTGRSGGNRVTLKPSDRQIQAAANAFRDALKEFFIAFPETGR